MTTIMCVKRNGVLGRGGPRGDRETLLMWRGRRKVFTQEELKEREGLCVGWWIPGRENSMCRHSVVCLANCEYH